MSNPIEDYALIGDGETAALVSRFGSVDWLCWPRFDDDSCFAALLGTPDHGSWRIGPETAITATRRRYQEDTLVVETDLEAAGGTIRLIDFMPERQTFSSLVRIVVGLRGTVLVRSDLRLRFDYGALPPWSEAIPGGSVAKVGPDLVVLYAPVPLDVRQHHQLATFTVSAGDRHGFVLRYGMATQPVPGPIDAEAALVATRSPPGEAGSTASTTPRRNGPPSSADRSSR